MMVKTIWPEYSRKVVSGSRSVDYREHGTFTWLHDFRRGGEDSETVGVNFDSGDRYLGVWSEWNGGKCSLTRWLALRPLGELDVRVGALEGIRLQVGLQGAAQGPRGNVGVVDVPGIWNVDVTRCDNDKYWACCNKTHKCHKKILCTGRITYKP